MIKATSITESTITGYEVVANLAPERVADHTKAAADENRPFGFIFRPGEATLTPVTETVKTVTVTMTQDDAESLWEFLSDMMTLVWPDRTHRVSMLTGLVPSESAATLRTYLMEALEDKLADDL